MSVTDKVDPIRCAFDEQGQFTSDNYCCQTLSGLRDKAIEQGTALFNDDQWTAVLTVGDAGEFLILSWCKSRGKTEGAWTV